MFEPDPYFINSITEVQMEMKMAQCHDLTADIIYFDEGITKDKATEYINNLDVSDKAYQKVLKDMYKSMRESC